MTLIGKVLANRYEILEEIGSGGMAVVYKAKCRLLNRFVAVKVLRPDLQNDDEFVRRFNVEAQAAASLTHPNIVSIFDVGNEDGLHYIVMEYIQGVTLKEYIDEKHILPWREAAGYAIQIAQGLEQAHKNSIIHRDIKPHNIIIKEDGVLKVTDFGIARANVQKTMTCEDSAIGSVHYISPEQARGGYTDERSDIYSLGIVLYEMLTGTVPFDSDRPVTVAIMHLQEKPVPPREKNLSIPLVLERIVLKAITKEVSSRYKTAAEMAADLESVLNDPSREVVKVPEPAENPAEDMGATKKMPAVKLETIEKIEIVEEEPPKEVKTTKKDVKKPAKRKAADIDRKKEKRVITIAIACAVAVILLISVAFLSITGIGGMLMGSKTVDIPDLEGMLYEEAVEKYVNIDNEDAEYRFNIIKGKEVENSLKQGTILSQDPEGGSKVKKKDVVVITVEISAGSSEIILKSYTRYKDSRNVELEMENLGLRAEFVEEFSDTIPTGSIISQEPQAGATVKKGDKITFYVSKGPEENEPDEGEDKPATNDNKPSGGNSGTTETPEEPKPPVQKKSTMLTLYGPKNKASALVQVNVNGSNVYSENLAQGTSDVVRLEGTSSTVEVEIFHDGVSQQKSTVKLH
ncbi:MAG: Stk1 family PASTA domain-containing Ser/Thr kinase [Ruminococcaceae bacterium]|nr:Stk1 family PASTA domain-containing Ser/Thr kinase [Oscillospiraceae bacterium]